jgi:hypothetical protein
MIARIAEYTITLAGERFNFTILASLASPLVVAIIIIVIEIIACYRWRQKTAGLRKSTHPQPQTGSNSSSRIVAELPSRTVAELAAQSESRLAVSSETSTTHISADVTSSTGDAGTAGGVSNNGKAGARLWMLSTDNAGRRVSNTDSVGSADGISSNEKARGALWGIRGSTNGVRRAAELE